MKEALKLALEALELPSMKTQSMLEQRDAAITAIKEALAQPEQEPVAFLTNHRQRMNVQIKPEAFVWMPTTTDWEVPLYTTPPQRKPLTDEEYSALAEQYTGADGLDCVDYGRAIARHYGIKE